MLTLEQPPEVLWSEYLDRIVREERLSVVKSQGKMCHAALWQTFSISHSLCS